MKRTGWLLLLLLACFLSACRTHPGWGGEQSSARTGYQLTRDGHYRVRKDDTLHAIAFNFGLDWRDIAGWNHIRAPYLIYPDQELRLTPPRSGRKTAPPPAPGSKASRRPSANTKGVKTSQASTKNNPRGSATSGGGSNPAKWLWPSSGRIIGNFKANDSSRKGIDISGREGQPIIATAAGEVVYSGSGLIAYGELIIIKHSDQFLSAYAHNRKRLVTEGQTVKAGAKIAEMGRNDRNQVLLHFEIRVNGNPRDPLTYLPRR